MAKYTNYSVPPHTCTIVINIDAFECTSCRLPQSPSPLKLNSKQSIRAASYFQESSEPCSTPLLAPAATRD